MRDTYFWHSIMENLVFSCRLISVSYNIVSGSLQTPSGRRWDVSDANDVCKLSLKSCRIVPTLRFQYGNENIVLNNGLYQQVVEGMGPSPAGVSGPKSSGISKEFPAYCDFFLWMQIWSFTPQPFYYEPFFTARRTSQIWFTISEPLFYYPS